MSLQAYTNYAMGPLHIFICLVSVLAYAFYFHLWGLNHWVLHHCNPLELTDGMHMCNLVIVIGPHQVCTEWLFPPLFLSRGSLLLLNQLSSSHSNYMVGHTALGAWQRVSLPSLHGGEGSSFPGLIPPDDMVNSESWVGIKSCDSGVVIW